MSMGTVTSLCEFISLSSRTHYLYAAVFQNFEHIQNMQWQVFVLNHYTFILQSVINQLQLFAMSVVCHCVFLVSIKSFFPTENIPENIVLRPLLQILQLSVRNLQKVSENWSRTPCKVTIQSSDYQCHLHELTELIDWLIDNRSLFWW